MSKRRRKPKNTTSGESSCSHLLLALQILIQDRKTDPYARLRVPKYQKVFEALFFASFLALYYAVMVERNPDRITATEILLYIWIAAFAYDEFGEIQDTGSRFYTASSEFSSSAAIPI